MELTTLLLSQLVGGDSGSASDRFGGDISNIDGGAVCDMWS